MKATITQERLKHLIDYDSVTGVFTNRVARGNVKAGSVSGKIDRGGYRRIKIDGRFHLAHRLAFLWMTGSFPPDQVDHRDGDRLNNAWANLRACTKSENQQNRKTSSNSKSGLLGAHWHEKSGKWQSMIVVSHKTHYLGLFDTEMAAHLAYLAKKKELHTFNPVPRNTAPNAPAVLSNRPTAPRPGMTPPQAFAAHQQFTLALEAA